MPTTASFESDFLRPRFEQGSVIFKPTSKYWRIAKPKQLVARAREREKARAFDFSVPIFRLQVRRINIKFSPILMTLLSSNFEALFFHLQRRFFYSLVISKAIFSFLCLYSDGGGVLAVGVLESEQ